MDFDEAKIQHIVYNLLSNALKFTQPGGKAVLHAHQELQDGQPVLKLKVSDTGVGIPEDELPHIFDRFYQVDSDKGQSTTRPGEGTGIGLAVTKELVELMGGSISVKSREAVGTDFTVLLPVRKNAAVRQPGSPAAGRNVQVETSGQNAVHEKDTLNTAEPEPEELYKLLLIEDNRDVATYLISILEKDYQVVTTEDGQAGIEKALELIPDIIISDVMMPRKDGFEVCRALKLDERTSHIPIIQARVPQALQHLVRADGQDRVARCTRKMPERVREERLSDAHGTDDGDVLWVVREQEPERHQLVEKVSIEGDFSAGIPVLQAHLGLESRSLTTDRDCVGVAARDLVLEQQ